MKLLVLFPLSMFIIMIVNGQTATNFKCKDCNGMEHELFAELDAGKVIVIDWVMPCGPCAGPTLTAYHIVQSYQNTYPGKIHMYVCDDFGDTPCIALASWLSAIGVTNVTVFSNPAINMLDYGSYGMPKIVIVAGPDRLVFYNANFTIDPQQFIQALEQAIVASSLSSREIVSKYDLQVNIAPNPSDGNFSVLFNSGVTQSISLEILDHELKSVLPVFIVSSPAGYHGIPVSTNLPAGIYFVRISTETETFYRKHVVIR